MREADNTAVGGIDPRVAAFIEEARKKLVDIGTRALRILRLFRIFALFKLGRIGGAAKRLGEAPRTVREEFLLVGVSAATVLLVSAFGIRSRQAKGRPAGDPR